MELLTAILVTGSLQTVGHYFAWQVWIGKPLGQLASYTWGVGVILVGLWVWVTLTYGMETSMHTLYMTIILSVVSGAVAIGTRGLDYLGEQVHYARSRKTLDVAASKETNAN